MLKPVEKSLLDLLVKKGILSQAQAQKVVMETQAMPEEVSSYLIRTGLASEDDILSAFAENLDLDVIQLRDTAVDKAVIEKVPVKLAGYYKFMPVRIENKILTLAVSNPLDIKVQDEIRSHLGFSPKIVLASSNDIQDALKKYYGLAAETIDRILTREPGRKSSAGTSVQEKVEDLEKRSEDASVINLVNQIILEACRKRATDIHIEPYREKVRFRYRIDGVLVDANLPPEIKHFLLPILSRIKIMSNLSIVEKRLPQDGSAVVKTKEQTVDLRVSTIPTPRGESMVIRILPSKVMLFSLEKLGLMPANVKTFRELIKKPHGIIFVTGPTGSGKTTTLYACLNEISSSERKIITIEDPIEYEMEGITQIQVNSKVELDFARGLRSILRHDPDIIMVGEVRDLETAETAIRTALTGHLVFSTLHTNDAASGITRLIEMGVEPYLVSSSVEAFVAQRLVRIICSGCKEEVKNPLLELKKEICESLKIDSEDKVKVYQGKGCERCNYTGFYGRTAIYEILTVSDAVRAAILEKRQAEYIKRLAMQQGMITLRQDGWRKVIEGTTTPAEVMNVTSKEDHSLLEEVADKKSVSQSGTVEPEAPVLTGEVFLRKVSKDILSAKNEYNSRIYARVPQKIQIRYRIFYAENNEPDALTIKGDEFEHSTVTRDISAGGLLFISSRPVPMGTILDLKIQLGEAEEYIDCLSRVCRVEEDELTNMFNIAAYYLDISSADRVKISEFVKVKLIEKQGMPS
ncbi:MAG TPA: ATPase, T2SS/T4P/T4SS family [Candidatus Omnitrophota bacterium]|nr:ATPase, T2SS/T4P/T4SS family [Candidatus Omnitrophota bacterium]HPD85141.1 ATPase, T2SS/T4P/T4SS family [Candidatus Omnitrophota bacterium]HRZ04358.1 ATPase, T2SS/T4P/T4SS family [Candidatus Omnitrophota bacterium]